MGIRRVGFTCLIGVFVALLGARIGKAFFLTRHFAGGKQRAPPSAGLFSPPATCPARQAPLQVLFEAGSSHAEGTSNEETIAAEAADLDERAQKLIDRLVVGLRARYEAMEQHSGSAHSEAPKFEFKREGAHAASRRETVEKAAYQAGDVERLRKALDELQAEKLEFLSERESELEHIEDMTQGQLEMRRALAAMDVDLRRSMARLKQTEQERDAAREGLRNRLAETSAHFGQEKQAFEAEVQQLKAAVDTSEDKRHAQQEQVRDYQKRLREMATELAKTQEALRTAKQPQTVASVATAASAVNARPNGYLTQLEATPAQHAAVTNAAPPPVQPNHIFSRGKSTVDLKEAKATTKHEATASGNHVVAPGSAKDAEETYKKLRAALTKADDELERAAKIEKERGGGASVLAQAHAAFRQDHEQLRKLLDVQRKRYADSVTALAASASGLRAGAAKLEALQAEVKNSRNMQAELKASVSALGLQLGTAQTALKEAEDQRGMEEVLRKAADEKLERERELRVEQTSALSMEVNRLRSSFERQKEAYEDNMERLQKSINDSATALHSEHERSELEKGMLEDKLASVQKRLAEEQKRYDDAVPALQSELASLQQHLTDMETKMNGDARKLQQALQGSQQRAATLAQQVEQMRDYVSRLEAERASVKSLLNLLGQAAAAKTASATAGPAAAARATAASAWSWRPNLSLFGKKGRHTQVAEDAGGASEQVLEHAKVFGGQAAVGAALAAVPAGHSQSGSPEAAGRPKEAADDATLGALSKNGDVGSFQTESLRADGEAAPRKAAHDSPEEGAPWRGLKLGNRQATSTSSAESAPKTQSRASKDARDASAGLGAASPKPQLVTAGSRGGGGRPERRNRSQARPVEVDEFFMGAGG